jgi:hypothetical protein
LAAVATALLVLLAVFLFVSAAAKAVSPAGATAALVGIGLEGGPARTAVRTITTLEAVAAAAIILWPDSRVAQALCLTLFGLFAIGGLLAVLSGRTTECGCMGALHRSKPGWAQLAQFVLITISVAIVAQQPPAWDSSTAAAVLLTAVVATATVLLAFAVPAWWQVRRARISIAAVADLIRRVSGDMAPDVGASGG